MKLMYITNSVEEALLAEKSGIDIIFVDLEREGKLERQGHLDTFISSHSLDDVAKISKVLTTSKLLVRINPYWEYTRSEVDQLLKANVDIIMLPMYKTKEEVIKFITIVGGRCKTALLLETKEAFARCNEIIEDLKTEFIHVGLNDLHLSFELDFMFEIVANSLIDYLANIIQQHQIPFGFGGIARLGEGTLSAELILSEHIRVGSEYVILSRSFRNGLIANGEEYFINEINKIRKKVKELEASDYEVLEENRKKLIKRVREIVNEK